MRKILSMIGILAIVLMGSCLGKGNSDSESDEGVSRGKVDKAFELLQNDGSTSDVAAALKPLMEKGGLNKLSLKDKCKLSVCVLYLQYNEDYEALESLGETKGANEFEEIVIEIETNPKADEILKKMKGNAKRLIEIYIPEVLDGGTNNSFGSGNDDWEFDDDDSEIDYDELMLELDALATELDAEANDYDWQSESKIKRARGIKPKEIQERR